MKKSAQLAFAFLALVWGSNYIFMKWAVELIQPSQAALLRVVFGLLPVLVYALATRALRWSHLRYIHHFFVMSLLAAALYYTAFAHGSALLPSGVAGVLSGSIPLFSFICAWLFLREERLNLTQTAGVVLGFAGIVLIARPSPDTTDAVSLAGIAWMMLGALSVGSSFVYARYFLTPLRIPAAALTTYQIGLACLVLLFTTDLNGIGVLFTDTRAWLGMVVGLGLLGTGVAYILYYYIIEQLGAVVASGSTYIPPVVALIIGVAFGGETVPLSGYLAVAVILGGVALLQYGGRQRKA